MLHALERDPAISAKYQFWTFSYDTYKPFWMGAAELRSELDRIAREYPSRKKIVLVGHSMGGVVSHMVLTDWGGKARTDVQKAIFIAAPHRGSDWGKLALTPALEALSPENVAFQTLDKRPEAGESYVRLRLRTAQRHCLRQRHKMDCSLSSPC
jgi:triacylglycerol esterase/lipase EstA (alpha/beta hydrolase family)